MIIIIIFSFIGISSGLPTTSYVKMIDIWMIFTMVIPLLEISLHTYTEIVRAKLINYEYPPKAVIQSFVKINPVQKSQIDIDENKR